MIYDNKGYSHSPDVECQIRAVDDHATAGRGVLLGPYHVALSSAPAGRVS